jgi:hypothetical protein
VPIVRRSVTRELRLLLHGVDGLAGDGMAAALQRVAEAATLLLRSQGAGVMLADEHQVLRCAAASGPPGRGLATARSGWAPARPWTRSPTGCRSPPATSPPTGAGPTCAT